jgi:hypothetical protein
MLEIKPIAFCMLNLQSILNYTPAQEGQRFRKKKQYETETKREIKSGLLTHTIKLSYSFLSEPCELWVIYAASVCREMLNRVNKNQLFL